jgi:2-oxoisovalerate dehydrogenase E1 alpha subunit N terminal
VLNRPSFQIRIPTPTARPGEPAAFDHLKIPTAGLVRRPDRARPQADLRDLRFDRIRILNLARLIERPTLLFIGGTELTNA